jgi:hypothetical protein
MKCVKCGRDISRWGNQGAYLGKGSWGTTNVCLPCLEKHAKEMLKTRTTCTRCTYFRFEKVVTSWGDATCIKLKIPLRPSSSEKIGIYNNAPFMVYWYDEAKSCVHFIDADEYKEKALKGEIVPEEETYFVVCTYCKARYDVHKNVKCPNCGAINP